MKVFDNEHRAHMMIADDGVTFLYTGYLDDGFHKYTILSGQLMQQFPIPVVSPTKETNVLGHRKPSWDSLRSVVDLCAGFGGLSQGALAAGFTVQVSVDHNPKMIDLHTKASDAYHICGEIGDPSVTSEIWRHACGASTLTSGFSCQPYSQLGDGRSQHDDRSSSLTKTLKTAYYLQAHVIVLECVSPAACDSFVKGELDHFIKHTGYQCSQTELKLEDVWVSRRSRSWWVLSSPEVGPIALQEWMQLHNVTMVQQVIPEISRWQVEDELQLALDLVELQAFGVNDDLHAKHLLNMKGKAPCALHAWGSQTRACPCGCRKYGFTAARLEAKGLHGCLVRSALLPDGTTIIRHLHPNEVMGLNTFDPVIDFGTDVRLTLSASGQLACPIQALWVLGAVGAHFDSMKHSQSFSPDAQIQAYRSWLLMRCRQVWKVESDPIQDPKLLSLMGFWQEFKDLSIAELVFPVRWEEKFDGSVSIASILDFLIRNQLQSPGPEITDCIMVDTEDLEETPVFDSPGIVDDTSTAACLCADSCTVVFEGFSEVPLRFEPKCGATLENFITAHAKLVGDFEVKEVTLNGRLIQQSHILEVGQVIVVAVGQPHSKAGAEELIEVSPTAPWTQLVEDPIQSFSPPRMISKFDVGECHAPRAAMPDDQTWLDASPLQGLSGAQFLKLKMPCIQNAQQLWSLRHQFLRSQDRNDILIQQGPYWADDEIRFHLHAILQSHSAYQVKNGQVPAEVCMIDPLVFTAWVHGKGFDCRLWAKDHSEIKLRHVPIVSVVLIDSHWVPLFFTPV